MKRLTLFLTLLALFACARHEPTETASMPPDTSPAPTASTPATPTPTPTPIPEKIDRELEAELRKIAEPAKGKVGIAAVLVETGETAYLDRNGRYPMQSVYKVPIAMTVLKMIDEGKVRIDQEISITPDDFVRPGFSSPIRNANPQGTVLSLAEVLRSSVSKSDGTATDVLLDLAGGPAGVMSYLQSIRVNDVIVANSLKEISRDWETQYRNWATPQGAATMLRSIHERTAGHSEQTTGFLLNIMTESETGDRRIKRGIPDAASLAHKTGTGGREKGITGATNDVGIITLPDGRHILLAVFVSDSPASGAVREKVIADAARTVIEKWAPASNPDKEAGVNKADSNSNSQ